MLKRNEELFSESTMSFGDHLEELRICLWRAVLWLTGGFIIGLFFGGNVVDYIQKPLRDSLVKYYGQRGELILDQHKTELDEAGYSLNGLKKTMREEYYAPEIHYVYPGQIESLLNPQLLPSIDNGPSKKTQNPLDTVDNLNQYERSAARAVSEISEESQDVSVSQPRIGLRENSPPVPFVLFQKLDDLSSTRSKALGAHEAFMIFIKAALVLGFVIASPGVFYSVWSFVAAGLYYHERKYVYIFMPFSIILFIAGAALAFFFVFGFVLDFLFAFNAWMDIDPDTRISEWMSFALMLPIGFGISFQLPLVIFVLERVGILTLEILVSKWKISVLIIFVISMLLTPADPQSMILMAIPLTILYFCGIALCYIFPKKKSDFEE